jgi:putative addiction module component (TIGR02574 family)
MAIETDLVCRAMNLSSVDRAELARQLILSLDPPTDDGAATDAWEAELERRLSAYDRGESTPIEWRDALERARASLRKPPAA